MQPENINILWFKRDLRLSDHEPMQAAIASGRPLLMLYIAEEMVQNDPHTDLRHTRFIFESIAVARSGGAIYYSMGSRAG